MRSIARSAKREQKNKIQSMNKTCKALWLTAFSLMAVITAVKAQPGTLYPTNDLIMGFSTGVGNDQLYDLGQESALVNGETWNLAFLLTGYGNYSGVSWGVIGNSTNSGSPRTLWTTTAVGSTPAIVQGAPKFSALNNDCGLLYENFTNAGAGQWVTVPTSSTTSWSLVTTPNATYATDYINEYENPNVLGVTSASFFQVLNNGSSPTLLGKFTLSSIGVVTYNTNSASAAPPSAGFTATPTTGFAPLKVIFTDASTGSITNWLWTFGDGHSVTNASSANVTNTYAATGKYTVTLTVAGPGGTNSSIQTNYIVASAAPKFSGSAFASGKVVFSGTNCPAGVQYRILSSTNLASGTWTPVYTNTFQSNGSFSYTNSVVATNKGAFFRLVSP